jgi:predicted nucleotidyltransferase
MEQVVYFDENENEKITSSSSTYLSSNSNSAFPQITQEMKEAVENFLKKIENKFRINIFYACDTGSRSMGVAAESSDFDINGFFTVPNPEDEKKVKKVISKDHIKDLIDPLDKFAEMYDIQIWDLNRWIEKKFKENINSCDFWFYSPIIYRNTLPEMFLDMKLKVSPPTSHFWGKFMNNYKLFKDRISKGVEHKKIMNIMIYGLWYLHCKIFKTFPTFNVS